MEGSLVQKKLILITHLFLDLFLNLKTLLPLNTRNYYLFSPINAVRVIARFTRNGIPLRKNA